MQETTNQNIEAETADAVPANGNSHAVVWNSDPPEGSTVFVPPSALSPGGHAETVEAEVVEAEVVNDEEEGSDTAEDTVQRWSPRLRCPLTADSLFRLARNVSVYDPARIVLGYRYEFELKRECAITLEFPIYKNDRMGLWTAIWRRRQNWGFFRCSAIDAVLYAYWNMFTGGETK
jgi:hypothetical protein